MTNTIRTLRRKVIIREYDFNKVRDRAFSLYENNRLYDRASFMPLDKFNIEKIKLIELLKGKSSPIATVTINLKDPALLLYQLKDYLYNEKYYAWNVSLDDEGFICVQSRINTPKTRLGWGVFEKDLKCRI